MTVTPWGTFQLSSVNVSVIGETIPSVSSSEEISMITSALGRESSTTANIACPPDSVVTKPVLGVTVIPGASPLSQTLFG